MFNINCRQVVTYDLESLGYCQIFVLKLSKYGIHAEPIGVKMEKLIIYTKVREDFFQYKDK